MYHLRITVAVEANSLIQNLETLSANSAVP